MAVEHTHQSSKKKCRCKGEDQCTFHPALKCEVPDFKRLQQEFADALARKRQQNGHRLATLPFTLSGSRPLDAKESQELEQKREAIRAQKALHKSRMEGSSSGGLVGKKQQAASPKVVSEPRDTLSARLKRQQIAQRAKVLEEQKQEEDEVLRKRKQKQRELTQKIHQALKKHQQAPHKTVQDRNLAKERFNHTTKAYMKQLKDMYRRLDEQPCLFERVEIAIAKQRTEMVYAKTLKKNGLTQESVQQAITSCNTE
jgi:hypothetical protein